MEDLAKRLKEAREGKGLTQRDASRALNMSVNVFCNYEAGIREPSLDTLKKICRLLDVSADFLLGLDENI